MQFDAVGIGKDSVGTVAHGSSPNEVTKIAIFDAHHRITSHAIKKASTPAFAAVALDGYDENDTTMVLIK